MDSVLIASNTSGTMQIISSLLRERSFSRIVAAQSGAEARRYMTESEFDLIIIDSPLPDEFGTDLSLHAAEHTSAGIILIVDESRLFDDNADAEDAGVFVLPKPISPEFFYQATKLLDASRRRILFIEDQNKRLQQQIQEIRVIDRAKLVLVQVLRMTEAQAHRYIEKQSMDLRQSRIQTAESILRTYEH
jgi:response regulator NasT